MRPFHLAIRLAIATCICLVAGCDQRSPAGSVSVGPVQSVDVSDPALTTKLGITTQDWRAICQLASADKGLVIKDASRAGKNTIDISLRKTDDTQGEQGGPVERFELADGQWILDRNFHGNWTMVK